MRINFVRCLLSAVLSLQLNQSPALDRTNEKSESDAVRKSRVKSGRTKPKPIDIRQPGGPSHQDNQPTVSISSTVIVENIKKTGIAARSLENDLQGVIEELEKFQQFYKESKCQGAEGDEGCIQISRQMSQRYTAILDTMAEPLPEMERNIVVIRDALEARLSKELGHNRTGHDLQQLLRKNMEEMSGLHRIRVRRQGSRLSDRFHQYFYLVNHGNRESRTLLGSEMYLDMDETSKSIQLTRQQLQRAKSHLDLSEQMGTITPEMDQTVSEVKRIIFGEYEGTSDFVPADLDALDGQKTPEDFCSEFDQNCR